MARIVARSRFAVLVGLALVGLAGYGLTRVPTSFIPIEDQGYLLMAVQLPDGAALGRTEQVLDDVATRARAVPGVSETIAIAGVSPLDNNATERDLRALTIGRRNWLFIGSREAGPRAAILYTVVASAARHNLDLWAYLRDVLERLALGEPNLESLLPDVWAAAHPEAVRSYRAHEREATATAKRARRERRRALERIKAQRR